MTNTLVYSANNLDSNLLSLLPEPQKYLVLTSDYGLPQVPWLIISPLCLFQFFQHRHLDRQLSHLLQTHSKTAKTKALLLSKIINHPYPPELALTLRSHFLKTIKNQSFSFLTSPSHISKSMFFQGDAVFLDELRRLMAKLYLKQLPTTFSPEQKISPLLSSFITVVSLPLPDISLHIYSRHPHSSNKQLLWAEMSFGLSPRLINQPTAFYANASFSPITKQLNLEPLAHPIKAYNLNRYGEISLFKPKHISKPNLTKVFSACFQNHLQLQNRLLKPIYTTHLLHRSRLSLYEINPLYQHHDQAVSTASPPTSTLILSGLPSGPGLITAPLRLIHKPSDYRSLQFGDILVTAHVSLDIIPHLAKISGIICESGGMASHLAIISREFGLPSIMSAKNALNILKQYQVVTLNGNLGQVLTESSHQLPIAKKSPSLPPNHSPATQVLLNTTQASSLLIPQLQNDAYVGLFRVENVMSQFGYQPHQLVSSPKQAQEWQQLLSQKMSAIYSLFPNSPLCLRLADLPDNERRQLKGHQPSLPAETNPFIGLRGSSWYLANPDFLKLQTQVFSHFLQQGYSLSLIIPYLQSISDLIQLKKVLAQLSLTRTSRFKLYAGIETPQNLLQPKEFLSSHIDGFYLNLNHLVTLITGIDSENAAINHHYTHLPTSIFQFIAAGIEAFTDIKLPVYAYGHPLETNQEVINLFVKAGITGLVTSPSTYSFTLKAVSAAETKT